MPVSFATSSPAAPPPYPVPATIPRGGDGESEDPPAPPQLFARQVRRQRRAQPEDAKRAPAPRFGHSAVVHDDNMIVYGGRGTRCHGDVWLLHLPTRSWRKAARASHGPHQQQAGRELPVARAGHTAVVWGGCMYVFGGVADGGTGCHTQWLDDLWALNLTTFEWRRAGQQSPQPAGPGRRRGHTAHVWQDTMLVYGGGRDEETQYGDLWELNLPEERWVLRPLIGHAPAPRMYHVSALTPSGRLVVFGGRTRAGAGFLNDTFAVDVAQPATGAPGTMAFGSIALGSGVHCVALSPAGAPPAPRMCAAAVCHNYSLAVLTGGAYAYLGDVHQLNLRTMEWAKVEGVEMYGGRTSPSAVRWRDAVVAFGGCNSMTAGGYLNDSIEVLLDPPSLMQVVSEYMKDTGVAADRDVVRTGIPDAVRAVFADGDAMMVDDDDVCAAGGAAPTPSRQQHCAQDAPMSPDDAPMMC